MCKLDDDYDDDDDGDHDDLLQHSSSKISRVISFAFLPSLTPPLTFERQTHHDHHDDDGDGVHHHDDDGEDNCVHEGNDDDAEYDQLSFDLLTEAANNPICAHGLLKHIR